MKINIVRLVALFWIGCLEHGCAWDSEKKLETKFLFKKENTKELNYIDKTYFVRDSAALLRLTNVSATDTIFSLLKEFDFIISVNRPINEIVLNSKFAKSDLCLNENSLIPVEILLGNKIEQGVIFFYAVKPKETYRGVCP